MVENQLWEERLKAKGLTGNLAGIMTALGLPHPPANPPLGTVPLREHGLPEEVSRDVPIVRDYGLWTDRVVRLSWVAQGQILSMGVELLLGLATLFLSQLIFLFCLFFSPGIFCLASWLERRHVVYLGLVPRIWEHFLGTGL